VTAKVRVAVRAPTGTIVLEPGIYFVGRSPECDIVLASARASRRHAKITVTEGGVTIEDLGSANGLFINGERVGPAPRRLVHDDFLVVGDLAMEVDIEEVTDSVAKFTSEPPFQVRVAPSSIPPGQATSRAQALDLLVSVADRALSSGNPERAERAVDEWLLTTLQAARSGRPSEERINDLAIDTALKLAHALGAQRWVDYVFQLLTALGTPMGADRAGRLEEALRAAGAQPGSLDNYSAKLRALAPSAERDTSLALVQHWRASVRR